MLLIAISGFQIYFWTDRVPSLDSRLCEEFGFLFSMIRLNEKGFQVVNIILYVLLLVACLFLFLVHLQIIIVVENEEPSEEYFPRYPAYETWLTGFSDAYVGRLQLIATLIRVAVASVVVTATELTILWNQIQDVNSVDTTDQIIPLIIGIVAFIRPFYVRQSGDEDIPVNKGLAGAGQIIEDN